MNAQVPSDLMFTFHWLDGKVTRGRGRDAADAMNRLGYGNGAVRALDYWSSEEIKESATDLIMSRGDGG